MKLDEKTTIQLWAVVVAIPVLAGAMFWFATVASLGEATAKTVDKLEYVIYKVRDDVAYLRAKEEKKDKH